MRVDLASLDAAEAARIRARLVRILYGAGWTSPAKWKHAIVLITPERTTAIHRLEFAAELREGGLTAAAHEVATRSTRPSEILTYILRDDERCAGAEFVVVAMRGGRP